MLCCAQKYAGQHTTYEKCGNVSLLGSADEDVKSMIVSVSYLLLWEEIKVPVLMFAGKSKC